jgi:hypothetical protein
MATTLPAILGGAVTVAVCARLAMAITVDVPPVTTTANTHILRFRRSRGGWAVQNAALNTCVHAGNITRANCTLTARLPVPLLLKGLG